MIIDIEDAIPDSERNKKVVEKLDKLRYKSYATYTSLYKSPSHTARRDYIIFLSVSQLYMLYIQLFISPLATQLEETISYSLVSVSFFHLYIHPLFSVIDKRYDLTFLYIVKL